MMDGCIASPWVPCCSPNRKWIQPPKPHQIPKRKKGEQAKEETLYAGPPFTQNHIYWRQWHGPSSPAFNITHEGVIWGALESKAGLWLRSLFILFPLQTYCLMIFPIREATVEEELNPLHYINRIQVAQWGAYSLSHSLSVSLSPSLSFCLSHSLTHSLRSFI